MERKLTEGNVFQTVLRFSLPYLAAYLLQTFYGLADLYIIGQFDGTAATTAVSIGSQVMHLPTVMLVGLAMGSTVLIGHGVGAGERTGVSRAIGNTITLFLGLSAAATVVLLTQTRGLVSLMSTPTEAVADTVRYLQICFLGIPFITAYNVIAAVFRGAGDSKSPMYFVLIACIANVGLDYLFIGALGMGAAGAALGTTLAQTLSVLISLGVMLRGKTGFALALSDLKPRREVLSALLKIGVPVALQDGFIQVSFLVITVIANLRGLEDAAAVGITEKIICILFLVPSSMGSSVSALAAQNLGAEKPERAKSVLRYGVLLSVGWGVCVCILTQLAAEPMIGLFSSSAAVVRLGAQYIRGYIFDCMLAGIHFCFSGYFCARGLSMLSFVHNSISIVCVRVPVAYLASVTFAATLFPMGLASTAGSALSALICIGVYVCLERRR